ncbi:MAG: hypothetical protein KY433_04935 [Actinobacteria bacterium]|nr:hypothetical protein [Actinomycetota bacterium]
MDREAADREQQVQELICRLAAAAIDGVLTGASDGRRVAECATDHARRRCTITLR